MPAPSFLLCPFIAGIKTAPNLTIWPIRQATISQHPVHIKNKQLQLAQPLTNPSQWSVGDQQAVRGFEAFQLG